MQTCIHTKSVASNERDYDKTVISLRLKPAEAVRFWKIMDAAKSRNAFVGKSDVYRELIGLDKPRALTQAEIDHFRGKRVLSDKPPELTYEPLDRAEEVYRQLEDRGLIAHIEGSKDVPEDEIRADVMKVLRKMLDNEQ